MTDKQIEKIKKEIPEYENGKRCNLTPEQEQLYKELNCRTMINSCLCYGCDFINSDYSDPYIKELGKERVLELYNEQKCDFDKSIVLHNVGQDGEGNYYNSIKWYDEIDSRDKDITDEMY